MSTVFTPDTNSTAVASRAFMYVSRCASARWLRNELKSADALFAGTTEMVIKTIAGIQHPAGRPREVVM
jgi:hypothetical protein